MNFVSLSRSGSIAAACALAAAGFSAPAFSAPILVFGQLGLGTPVSAVATGSVTTLSASDAAITISGIDAAPGSVPLAYLSFSSTSTDAAAIGLDGNVRQNFSGMFSIFSGLGKTGTNYLSGTFDDLFEALGASATLIASTPVATNVTFTSDVIPAADLGLNRAISFSFTGVTPSVFTPIGGTLPNFNAAISGNFSAENTSPAPEAATWAMFVGGFGFLGATLRRKKVAVTYA